MEGNNMSEQYKYYQEHMEKLQERTKMKGLSVEGLPDPNRIEPTKNGKELPSSQPGKVYIVSHGGEREIGTVSNRLRQAYANGTSKVIEAKSNLVLLVTR
jgi:hypothetical protein